MESTTLGAFLRTVRHAVVSRLIPDDLTRVCSEDGVLILDSDGIIRKWFEVGIFRVSRRMYCNPSLAHLAIARLSEFGWDVTGVEWLPVNYERSRFIFVPPISGVTCKRADGTEVTKGGHDEVRSNYCEDTRIAICFVFFLSVLGNYSLKTVTSIRSIRCWRSKTW